MPAAYIECPIPGTGLIMGQDIWGTIDEVLHEHTPELGLALSDMVRALTPILTGALISDVTFEAYPDPAGIGGGENDLVWIYAEDLAQEAYWNRIYVQYQEGGLLGEPTYTNAPHEMFYLAATTDGLAYTEVWAIKWIEWALLLVESGAGVPW